MSEPTVRDATRSTAPSAPEIPRWRRLLGETLLGGPLGLSIPLVCAALAILLPLYYNDPYWIRELSLIFVLALVVSGVNLSFGYAGEIQFGQVFMFALGAYASAILAIHQTVQIIPLLLIGGFAAALVGMIIAPPALRIGGWALALTSFFLVITIPDLVTIFTKWTGGGNGLVGIPIPKLFGTSLTETGLYEVTVVVTIIWFAIYRNLVTSRYGVSFRILRQSPVLASSLGLSTARLKMMAYTFGAFPAGMAGCLFGFISVVINPTAFGLALAIGIVAACLLGGIESVYGVFIGAAVLQLGPEQSLSFAEWAPVAYGVFLLVAAILFRQGISGVAKLLLLRLSRVVVGPQEAAQTIAPGSLSAHVGEHAEQEAAEIVEEQHGLRLGTLEGRRLAVGGVSKSFGGLQALSDVTLSAEPGQVTALIGSNGSGKTTLLNVISGYTKPTSGRARFGEEAITGLPAHRVAHAGIGRTFQTPSVPRGVSALDVVASGRFSVDRCGAVASILRLPRYWRTRRADRREALLLLDLVGLAHIADAEASSLSLGTRRLVEVARALCARPGLLLLDEPASGLSDDEVVRLGQVIRAAADAGATVVLIEHNFGFVTAVSDTAHVLHFGQLIASGPAAVVAEDPRVIESYLGQSATTPSSPAGAQETEPVPGEDVAGQPLMRRNAAALGQLVGGSSETHTGPLLALRDVVSGYGDLQVLRDLSLELERGKVELVLGRNGVGKTTMLNTITGQVRLWSGSILLDGEELGSRAAYRRSAAGVALVQEGKRIFRERTIAENIELGTFTQSLSRAERQALRDMVLEQFPLLQERAGERAGGLSGGQQQMLAIAQALTSRPRLLLLDEPSAGLAPAIVSEVFERVRQLSEQGMTILLVEQLAEKALTIADHVTLIDNGRVVASGAPEEFVDQRGIQDAYFGAAAAGSRDPVPLSDGR